MSLHMQSKVVWTRKTAFTMTALKGFDPCMLPVMPGQLVRPSKSPFATFPGTAVGFFTCNNNKIIRYSISCGIKRPTPLSFYSSAWPWNRPLIMAFFDTSNFVALLSTLSYLVIFFSFEKSRTINRPYEFLPVCVLWWAFKWELLV